MSNHDSPVGIVLEWPPTTVRGGGHDPHRRVPNKVRVWRSTP